jgi:hypothetical protein
MIYLGQVMKAISALGVAWVIFWGKVRKVYRRLTTEKPKWMRVIHLVLKNQSQKPVNLRSRLHRLQKVLHL